MQDDTRTLIETLTNGVIEMVNQEIKLGQILREATDMERTEIAFFMEDAFMMHPNGPSHSRVTMAKIETYIAYHLRRAEWEVAWNDLYDEADEIEEMDRGLFEDDDVTLGANLG